MGISLFTYMVFLALSSRATTAQEPNTDGFYVKDFIVKMNLVPNYSNASSICPNEVSCSVRGKDVVGLVASGPRFMGAIPENTIGKLNKLENLSLTNTGITSLPSDFWGLGSSLQRLNLSFNRISGSLDNEISNLGKLESLDLSHNRFSGQLPLNMGSLSRLRYLNASMNEFEGKIPDSILGCKALVTIDLSSNKLSGSPSDEYASAFRYLNTLNLAGNKFRGRLPNTTGLRSISYLNLSGNEFDGPVSSLPHKSLQIVDLSNNKLNGHISQVSLDSNLSCPSLFYLDLSGNLLSGTFFSGLDKAKSLKHLNLACNRFSTQELPIIGELSKLEYLNFSNTSITGKIPSQMTKLVSLEVLDLSVNHLEGRIPLLSIEKLKELDLSVNNLTGEIPLLLQEKLLNMSRFNFSFNNLSFCSSKFSYQVLESAFKGSHNNCPIAAKPDEKRAKRTRNRRLKLALAIVLSAVFLIVGLACFAVAYRRRQQRVPKKAPNKEEPIVSGPFSFETDSTTWVADVRDATSVPVVIFEKPLLNFTFTDLLVATSNFDRGTLLAEGKFGPVYRGVLPEGIHVAVKVLVHGSTLTDQEAAAEFERIGRIKHLNLVPLSGYCLAGEQRIAIYEYMEHGNLQNLLHDLPLGIQTAEDWSNDTWDDDNDGVQSITSEGQTTWRFRHRIALGTARALAFLHHGCIPQIIHRDVKASSIYLDSSFEPRLSDFGLAKIVGSNFEDEISRASPGYTPPELSGTEPSAASSKSDVYGFGVVLFELLTGKKPVGDEYPDEKDSNLVSWVRGLFRKNQLSDAIDPKIHGTGQEKQMEEALRIGYLCTAESPSKRPSMQQIVGLLKDIEPSVIDQ